VFAADASISAVAATNGLVLRAGQPAVPEDQANFHNVDEQVFSLSGAVIELDKSVVTVQDPVSGAVSPKAIPGAWLEYQIEVTNHGPDPTDSDSMVMVDAIPAEVALCVDALCASGGDPIEFDESASPEPTGLSYAYPVNVTFSMDGTDYSYNPVPDASGFDPAVRFVRVAPEGAMNGPGGGGDPLFHVRYRIRVD
jgi:hypothetical protein